jgi:hypothetical protein
MTARLRFDNCLECNWFTTGLFQFDLQIELMNFERSSEAI